jgi:hypothetical protein
MSKINWQIGLALFLSAFLSACNPSTPNADVTIAQQDPNPTSIIAPILEEQERIYLWPTFIPDEVKINTASSSAGQTGFLLELVDSDNKVSIRILGEEAPSSGPCPMDLEKVQIRNVEACYASSSNTGYVLQWSEHGMHFLIGGTSTSRELTLQIAQSLEEVDLETWKKRLKSVQE